MGKPVIDDSLHAVWLGKLRPKQVGLASWLDHLCSPPRSQGRSGGSMVYCCCLKIIIILIFFWQVGS